jgi:translation initiation factor eIF-2B subunit alpha
LDDFTELNETTTEHYAIILIKVMMNLIESSKGILFLMLETTM